MELKVFVHVVTYRVPNQILDIVHDILYLSIYLLLENLFIYLAVSDLSCGTQGLRCVIQDPCCHSWTLAVACGLQSTWGSVVVARGLRCSMACGILVPRPGSNGIPCTVWWILIHWTIRDVPTPCI